MSATWIPVDTEPQREDGCGLDPVAFDDCFSVRFRLDADPRPGEGGLVQSFVTVYFFVAARLDGEGNLKPDGDGDPVIWLGSRTEAMVCSVDPATPDSAGEERWCLFDYDDLDRFFPDVRSARAGAEDAAWRYLKCPALFNRDIEWDGLAPWEG